MQVFDNGTKLPLRWRKHTTAAAGLDPERVARLQADVGCDARMGLPFGDEVIAVGPTSTVIGTAIAQAIATEAAAQLVARGIRPPLFQSGNQDGSGPSNDDELRRAAPRTPSLLAADVSRLASSDD